MIHYIKGIVKEILPGIVVIENGNIGYEVHVTSSSSFIANENELVTLYTAMIVREDDVSLYGFSDSESLGMFNLLMTVGGVGAKAALSILSALSCDDIRKAIAFDDPAPITSANGIGKKIAQRIVLELKDKVGSVQISDPAAAKSRRKSSERDNAAEALIALGYSRSEALSALSSISEDDLSTEEYIKRALRARR